MFGIGKTRSRYSLFVALFAIGLLAGCHQIDERPPDSGWGFSDTDRPDVEEDTEPEPDTEPLPDVEPRPDGKEPGPTTRTFRLVNESNHPVRYIEPGCKQSRNDWIQLHRLHRQGDSRLRFAFNDCGLCRCSQVEGERACGNTCFACPVGDPKTLNPGEKVEYNWPGYVFREGQEDGQACQRRSVPADGARFTARFCWIEPKVTTDIGPITPKCRDLTIKYGRSDLVEVPIEKKEPEKPVETTFRLKNRGKESIYYKPPSACHESSIDWIQVDRIAPNDAHIRQQLRTNCTDCMCSEVENGKCPPRCAIDCAATRPRELKPGETTSFTWKGYVHPEETVDGATCRRKTVPKKGEGMWADFCWIAGTGNGLPSNPRAAANCRGKFFQYGKETTVVYDAPPSGAK